MIDPRVKLDLRDVDDAIRKTNRRARNLNKAWRDIAPFFQRDQKKNFAQRRGPSAKWEPRAESTIKRNAYGRPRGMHKAVSAPTSPTKSQLGQLRSFSIFWGPAVIKAVNKIAWSGAHQDGGPVGNNATLPARIHHWASDALMDIVEKRIAQHIGKPWR